MHAVQALIGAPCIIITVRAFERVVLALNLLEQVHICKQAFRECSIKSTCIWHAIETTADSLSADFKLHKRHLVQAKLLVDTRIRVACMQHL